jgi:Flp pilus assembly pilin Flp
MGHREAAGQRLGLVNRNGAALAEYVMILLFVAVACVIGATLLGATVQGFYNGINGSF